MKRFSALLAFLLLAVLAPCRSLAASSAPANDDTIMVKLPNQATMTLYVKNKEQLRQMRTYKLDSLMLLLDAYITQAEAVGQNSKTDQVTLEFYPAKERPGTNAPEQIRVTVRSQDGKGPAKTDRVDVMLGRMGVTVKDSDNEDGVSVHIGRSPSEDSIRNVERQARQEEKRNRRVHQDFTLDLGLNTLVHRPPLLGGEDFELRPVGSRYVSLNWHYDVRVGDKNSPLHLITGPELAFNNYMLDKNFRFRDVDGVTMATKEPTLSLEKSKLAVTTLNLPLMVLLDFDDSKGRNVFRIGAGGFVGYRLGAHTKLKYESEGSTRKDKDRGNYNLEEFQYGVQGTVGIRNIDLFVKYNLNDTFKASRGPGGQTLSFGLSLCN
ncbi:PorT family protein [Hymenobacter sp. J193]|uniref:porin family protein n=1 Tax=Hymenobacter sp. J193 TaxID=2898429 RepID=UPI0021512568|nr:porin family protein [Hymenobacter sp. J193]MCR5890084.1 PorT family protein [Hymenobacter sp. J193]